jgi:anti-sigma B factor antagonist
MAELDAGRESPQPDEAARLHAELLSDVEGVVTFRISGQFDISTEQIVRDRLRPAITAATAKLILDVSELTFMDSSGLAVLLVTAHEVPAIELRNPSEVIRRLITIAGLGETLPVVADA